MLHYPGGVIKGRGRELKLITTSYLWTWVIVDSTACMGDGPWLHFIARGPQSSHVQFAAEIEHSHLSSAPLSANTPHLSSDASIPKPIGSHKEVSEMAATSKGSPWTTQSCRCLPSVRPGHLSFVWTLPLYLHRCRHPHPLSVNPPSLHSLAPLLSSPSPFAQRGVITVRSSSDLSSSGMVSPW